MGGLSPIGSDWTSVRDGLRSGRNGVKYFEEWRAYAGLNACLGAPVEDFKTPKHYPRKLRRAMGRVSLLAVRASEMALEDAGLLENPVLRSGRTGVAYGSSVGSPESIMEFGQMMTSQSTKSITANSYVKMMPHTTTAAVGMFFGLTGRVLPSSTACTSGSLSIGLAYECIRYGLQDVMLAGGAEELSVAEVAAFDTLYATSTRNDSPETTPRPFDADRDGLVVGEGAGTLVLESLEHAEARGANIIAEVVGFGTNSDGNHPTQPTRETMAQAMRLSLIDAGLEANEIGYVNAHGTATELGDIAESQATRDVLGNVPISSLKGYMGHTLGACGALEAWMSILMLKEGWATANLNLANIDDRCAELDYIVNEPREMRPAYLMTNNFAFGGVNTSLIFNLNPSGNSYCRPVTETPE